MNPQLPEYHSAVTIDNLEDLKDALHHCTSQDLLTDIRIAIAGTQRDVDILNVSIQKLQLHLVEELKMYQEDIKRITTDLNEVKYNTISAEKWQQLVERVEELESTELIRIGSGKWEARILTIVQTVAIAAIIAMVLFFMRGGEIT